MKTRQELKQNPELLKDKCRGAIIGIAIGDSFGDASRKPDNQLSYGITTDFHKGASWSTDDTEFALLTAKTILECKGQLTDEHVVKAWLENVATQDEFKRAARPNLRPAATCGGVCGLRCPASTTAIATPTARPCVLRPWACTARAISTRPSPWRRRTRISHYGRAFGARRRSPLPWPAPWRTEPSTRFWRRP